MNKKKLAALALSGTLLMGGAGFGAYSWFTSSTHVDPNLTIATGMLRVSALDSNEWKNMDLSGKSQASVDKSVVTNAQPGDQFFKIVTIKNTGSLDEMLNFTPNTEIKDQYKGAINVTIGEDTTGTPADKLQNVLLPAGESMTVRVVVGLDGDKMGNVPYNGMKDPIKLNEALKGNLVTVEAIQTNHPSVPEPHADATK